MSKHVDKPIRLYVMTIFIVIAYGFLPLVSTIPIGGLYLLFGPRFLPYNGSVQVLNGPDGDISIVLLVITLTLSFFAAGSAIVTFLGVQEGRSATLIFLTLDVGWWFFLVVTAILNNNGPQADAIQMGSQLIFPPAWLVFVWWNLTRPDITAWLKYKSELDT